MPEKEALDLESEDPGVATGLLYFLNVRNLGRAGLSFLT